MRGSGKNLSEASSPTYFECSNSRIALSGVTSSFHDSYLAGLQNQEIPGRPEAPLRHEALYERDAKNYEDLKRIAADTGINNYHNQARKEGFCRRVSILNSRHLILWKAQRTKYEQHLCPLIWKGH